jgi:hypothetical protein
MTTEIWKRWRGSNYSVSSLGRVRRDTIGNRTHAGRILTQTILKIGYYKVAPVIDGKNVFSHVHVMVAECFIGPRPRRHDINHIDGIKTNNRATNLEYVTHGDNMRHAAKIGLMVRGEDHGGAKLSNRDAGRVIAMRKRGVSGRIVAEQFGIAQSTVSQIFTGKRRATV